MTAADQEKAKVTAGQKTNERVAELLTQAPPLTAVQREAVVRILARPRP